MFDLSQLDFSKDAGYVTVVAQDAGTGLVLMVARADRDSIVETLATGELQYHARADGRWQRRPSGANRQRVVSLACDCDGDALLARVVPAGPTCHTGASSCFTGPEGDDARVTEQGSAVVATAADAQGPRARLQKLGDEAAALIAACARDDVTAGTAEVTNLVYRTLVALCAAGGSLADVQRLLGQRAAPASSPLGAHTFAE
ncbi:MAG TPA: phosphoribosyl-AMP cyclohydrolase [Gemmatimonadaceae bacterium]|jgi:phosphoribosyl-ATP pyrophosphohydrolase/phosphoribosyl-AMP cyclohydrolase